uniref:50S ribosomal subunit n=1 Tax=Siphoviridae sp. ctX5W26 TaxID=2825540 RepID=A0A8S5UEH4_9CAUD|nr:MAG TPA: 50S ribosomal subunit [Siphoviridae sp. ctX5W26]
MEIKEAIKILEKDIHTDIPKAAVGARKHVAAVRMALVALEKQIPVNPIILDTLNGNIEYVCCLCGKNVISSVKHRNNYCGECGCKFDWSEFSASTKSKS